MKKIISGIIAASVMLGSLCVSAQSSMMVDVTNSTTKLVALKEDGTIKIHGYDLLNNDVVNELSGIKQIAVEDFSENTFFALREDGTVKQISKFERAEFSDVSNWTDIVYIDGGNGFVAGLKSDGTIVICGSNLANVRTALQWKDIVSVYAKEDTIIGINTEGNVLVASVRAKQSAVANWTNMKKVIYDSNNFWGITNDGELITTETKYKVSNIKGAELLGDFADIEALSSYASTGFYAKVYALKNDGRVIEITNETSNVGKFSATVLYEDICHIVTGASNYAMVLRDGEILSDRLSISSADWILGIDIRVGGKYIICDVPPYIKNDRTMVPIRAISEALGAEVGYDDATKTAIISKDGKTIKITMDSATAYIDDNAVTLDAPAENVNSRIFVPVRFISEGFGCEVKWVAETKSVMIN